MHSAVDLACSQPARGIQGTAALAPSYTKPQGPKRTAKQGPYPASITGRIMAAFTLAFVLYVFLNVAGVSL